MSINFPLSPTPEQIYTFEGRSWRWDGRAWRTVNYVVGYTGSAGSGGGGATDVPKITNIQVTDSSYTVLDDTAIDIAGGYIKITGTGFASGCVVMINNVLATSTTFVSSTEVRAQLPATAAGTYVVYLVNTDGGVAIRINGITFSATPAWTTGSSLVGVAEGTTVNIQLAAAGASVYSLAAGSSLPGTLTVSSSGLISGVLPSLSLDTTYSFTVVATDAELQDSPRTFSITITVGDIYFASTTLLLPGSATTFVRDGSVNNLAVAVTGDTRPSTFNPYLTGWSNFFDGTGDYLTVPYTAQFLPGSGNFTVEAWTYVTSTANAQATLAGVWRTASGQAWLLVVNGSTVTLNYNTNQFVSTAAGSAPANQWNHIAWVKNGSTNTIYINGVASATGTAATINNSSDSLGIGFNLDAATSNWNFSGHVSNLRIVKGTAVYTANFTPSTTPLTAIAGTSLLTCADNRFVDDSTNNFAITRTGDVTVNSFSPFLEPATTRGSSYFDGTGDSLSVAATAPVLLNGDYTVEAWIWLDVNNLEYPYVFYSGAFYVRFGNTGFGWKLQAATVESGLTSVYSCSVTQTDAVKRWTHVALTRQSGVNRLFVNGVQQNLNTGANPGTYPLVSWTDSATVGGSTWTIGGAWNGNISNFRIVKGTAVYTANFTPPTQPLTAIANTSLLTLQNNQPANNSAFLDSSSNNLVVTRNGNTTQGTFSPYSPSGWSNYFDGTGDYLTVPANAGFSFGTGDFTVEAWVYYPPISGTNGKAVIDARPASTNGSYWVLGATNTGIMTFATMTTGGVTLSDTTARPNQWVHYAATRSGTALRFFANGTQIASATNSDNMSSSGLFVGANAFFAAASDTFWNGYISNLRIIKGTAVYTANFTPPTQPLTAIAGTSLLTCADNRFMDESPNNFAITRNGDARVTNFSPFKAQVQTPRTYSAYFDGSSSISVPDNAAWALGTSDFTIECWVNGSNTLAYIFNQVDASATERINLRIVSTGIINFRVRSNSIYEIDFSTTSNTLPANTWTHIAVVRNGSSFTIYINGVSSATTTSSVSIPNISSTLNISDAAAYYTGRISNFRWVKGTAVYTANFTPPTQPLTAIANTSLLTCQSPTFVDNSTNTFAITAAGNTQPTTVNPFGSTFANSTGYTAAEYGGSMYFDGTVDYLSTPYNPSFDLVPGSWTFECWAFPTATKSASRIFSTGGGAVGWNSTTGIHTLIVLSNTNLVGVQLATGTGTPTVLYNPTTVNINTWNHIAVCVNTANSKVRVFLNGVMAESTYTSYSRPSTNPTLTIGTINGEAGDLNTAYQGYISNLRIVKGTALYTSNFVPPLAPVTPTTNTALLLNGTAAAITDATTKNVLETVGDVKISSAVSKFGGSSMYFDGTGDYLLSPASLNNSFGTENFTVECWFYRSAATSGGCIMSAWSGTVATSAWIMTQGTTNTGYLRFGVCDGTTATFFEPTTVVIQDSTWVHLAVTRSGGTLYLFANGTLLTSVANTTNILPSAALGIGAVTNNTFASNGYIQDLRITKGVARYTANFIPPTAPLQIK